MAFDLETLYLSSALSRAAYLVVFLVVALRQPREIYLWHWIGAIIASAIGSAIMMAIPTTRWLLPVEAVTVYTFYAGSLALSWSGLRLFNGRTVSLPFVALLTVLPGTGYALAFSLGVSMSVTLAGVILVCAGYAAAGAHEALRRSSEQLLWSAYIASATLGCYSAMLLLTFAMLVGTDLPMNSSNSGMISMIVDQASGILIYFSYIAMAKEQAVLTIEHLAETDPLTGLVNRRGLRTALGRHGRRSRLDSRTGVLLADIDHFKAINDTYGHEAGDAVLVAFSQALRGALRKNDIVVRWGGEEFLVLLPQTELRMLQPVAERLRSAIEAQRFALPNGATIPVTVSIGISEMPHGAAEFESAARRADTALYEAKASGRNRICAAPLAPSHPLSAACAA